jgi:glycosyltransferase involved in cell wall biosynthesis
MTPGLISVYVPTKDRQALLSAAVDSVLRQTYPHLELLVVNDGSTDDTRAYLDALVARDPRVQVIHNERSLGAPRSRNRAIELATGEFVTGLDDDDRFHPERLEALLHGWQSEVKRGRLAAVFSQDEIVKGHDSSATRKPPLIRAEQLFFHNQIGNQIFTLRDYLLEVGSFDAEMPAWQDLDLFIRVLRRFGPAKLVDRPLYVLNVDPRPDRISLGGRRKLYDAYRRIVAKSADASAAQKQALFLQLFGALYNQAPSIADLNEFLRYGFHGRNVKRLAGIYARRVTGIW